MSKIQRYGGNFPPFARDFQSQERTSFGTEDVGDNSLDGNINADWLRGWGIISPSEFPPIQYFNALGFTLSQALAYLHQQGVPEWNAAQEYFIGSVTKTGGRIYIAQTGTDGSPNVGIDPATDDGTNWLEQPNVSSLRAETLSDLQALSAGSTTSIYVLGRSAAGDGGEGHFRWDSSDLSTEVGNDEVTVGEGDGGIYVAPDSDKTGASGAWVRNYVGSGNPLWYGAKGDGATDDSAAFSALLSAHSSVYIPGGYDFVVGSLSVSQSGGVTIYGDGFSSKITQKVEDADLFDLSSASDTIRFERIRFDAQRSSQAADIKNHLIHALNNPNGVRVEVVSCHFRNVTEAAIYVFGDGADPRDSLYVTGSTFENINEGDASFYNPTFVLFGDGADCVVSDNDFSAGYAFSGTGAGAVRLASNLASGAAQYTRANISNNRVTGLGRSASNDIGAIEFYIWGENIVIHGNDLKECHSHAIRGKTNSNNVSITGNAILNADGEGIVLNAGTETPIFGRVSIADNALINCTGAGVAVRSDSNDDVRMVSISGNTIRSVQANGDGDANGVWCEFVAQLLVSGNIIRESAKRSIYTNECVAASITHNVCQSSTEEGIYVETTSQDVVVSANHLNTFNNVGVFINAARSVICSDNLASGNQNTGVTNEDFRLTNSTLVMITDNHSDNTGSEFGSGGTNTTLRNRDNSWQT